ncbi:hypothetical protein JI664_21550 [Rhodobacter sp. NTK016B]|uniref:hypothetical protein n=1 Tax=Rhodobacter sp. NTK016B TaxID=2759676 RepID=UPI001A8CCA5C|nr:hypothetical protein [Rhodobacter sp. NTK016B]MBN8294573.1 hypothetical protein [Rhodobacter sp. NTK016B]
MNDAFRKLLAELSANEVKALSIFVAAVVAARSASDDLGVQINTSLINDGEDTSLVVSVSDGSGAE